MNPLTALCQLDVIKQKGAKACLTTAAASSLNKLFIQVCQSEGVDIVNIVRKDNQVAMLKDNFNAKYVLDSSSESFKEELKKVIELVNPTVMFDYIGGTVPAEIFELMPPTSEFVAVANLTHLPVGIDTGHLMFTQKTVRGLMVY